MHPASTPSGYRIDVNTATGNAYRSLFENAQLAAGFGWLPLVIVLCSELLAFLIVGGGVAGSVVSGIVRALAMLVFETVFLARWYRFLLLGEVRSERFFTRAWQELAVVSFKFAALIFLAVLVLVAIAAVPPHIVTALIALFGAFATAVAAVRISLVFPAAALEQPILFRTAWQLLGNEYWRLFACVFLCAVPFAVVEGALDRAGAGHGWFAGGVLEAAALAVEFAGMAVVASLLSQVYRDIAGDPRGRGADTEE